MHNVKKLLIAAALLCNCPAALAQADAGADAAAVRAQADSYSAAFLKGDARALASMWTEDGTFTDTAGRTYKGRAEIARVFEQDLLRSGGQKLKIDIDSLRFPSANVAIEEGSTRVLSGPLSGAMGRYIAIHTKVDGKWLMYDVVEMKEIKHSSANPLSDIDWLLGKWQANKNGATVTMEVGWAIPNVFMESTFRNKDGNVIARENIGVDPATGSITTWHFDQSGGISKSVWNKVQDQWVLTAKSLEADGTSGRAINYIKKIDNGKIIWHSQGRRRSGQDLPDTGDITLDKIESIQKAEAK